MRSGLSEVEDIDLPKTVMDLQMQQVSYQAALSVTAKVIQPSLAAFLRCAPRAGPSGLVRVRQAPHAPRGGLRYHRSTTAPPEGAGALEKWTSFRGLALIE